MRIDHNPLAHRLGQYAEDAEETFTIEVPEDLSTLSDEELAKLESDATEAAQGLLEQEDPSDEDLAQASALADTVEQLRGENETRIQAAEKRKADRENLKSRLASEKEDEGTEAEEASEEEAPAEESEDEKEEEALVASSKPQRTFSVKARKARQVKQLPVEEPQKVSRVSDHLKFAGQDAAGMSQGMGLDWQGAGKALSDRLRNFPQTQYANAANMGRAMSSRQALFTIQKPVQDDLTLTSSDPEHVESVLKRASDETRLEGNSLVASGGWCAPSEVMYDLLELESRDGIYSLPEVTLARGGVQHTLGPDFSSIFTDILGFHYTEDQDIAGNYGVDDNGIGNDTAGEKPCYHIECPEFVEDRLNVDGLCLTAGLLQRRAYPEVISRVVRGALVAHDHRLAGRVLADVVAGSDAVELAGPQGGATAPILSAIELEVEKIRYKTRMGRNASMEGVFPFWVRGAIRADLSRRLGVELLAVTDAQINGWFSQRGIRPQFVYNWQDLDVSTVTATVEWPREVQFLLYPAGTWIRGNADIITIDTLYDSVNLRTNDYTALFTEEGYVTMKRGHESRLVTVSYEADGATHMGVDLEHNGTIAAAPDA